MNKLEEIEQACNHENSSKDCRLLWIIGMLNFWHLFLGLFPIIFITRDIWRAFKKRKHWIPAISLVLSSFSLQLLTVLNNSLDSPFRQGIDGYGLVPTLAGKASICVFIGYFLPAVAIPLSWSDIFALIVSSSIPLSEIAYDIYNPNSYLYSSAYEYGYYFNGTGPVTFRYDHYFNATAASFSLIRGWNVAMFVSIIILLVLLTCAYVASVGIHQIVCRKIPIILSPQKWNHQFSWDKVEDHIVSSFILVRSANPQYILARSILTSPIAFIAAICIGIIMHASLLQKNLQHKFAIYLLFPFIMLGSGVIFWRCITATVYYPRKINWKWSSLKQYFKMENFWLSYLEELQARSLNLEGMGKSRFKKWMNSLWRETVLYRSLRVLIWMQTFLVVLSKTCWLLLQLLLSNKYMESLFMGSASLEFSYLTRKKNHIGIVLGKAFEFDKYCKALLQLPGECPAGTWIANRKSIEFIKKHMRRGEEEGKKCNELMWLLKHKLSSDFSVENHVKPHQNNLFTRFEVERDLNVFKPSFKMAVVSLLTLLAELASFTPITDHNNLISNAIKACSQSWNIMDIVEDAESKGAMLSKSADKLFQDLQKSRRWLGHHLPFCKGVGNSDVAAKASIQSVVERAKLIAMEYESRNWDEVAAGYTLYSLSLNLNYQELTTVQEISDKICSALADVVASCTVKAVGVAMKDCEKWASMFEEDKILKAAHIVGKVRNLMENVQWQLKWSFNAETQSVETSVRNGPLLRKYATFQSVLEFDGC